MNIEARKIELARLLFNVETNKVLDKIETLLKGEKNPQLSDELKATLDDRLKKYEENPNEGQSWEEVRRQISAK